MREKRITNRIERKVGHAGPILITLIQIGSISITFAHP